MSAKSLVNIASDLVKPRSIVLEGAHCHEPSDGAILAFLNGMDDIHNHHWMEPMFTADSGPKTINELALETIRQVLKHYLDLFEQLRDGVGLNLCGSLGVIVFQRTGHLLD